MEIIENTTSKAWTSALSTIFEKGEDFIDKDKRVCRQILNLMIRIDNPETDITHPIEIMRSSTKWIYPDLGELKKIILDKNVAPAYYYAYGNRLFNFDGTLNQIDDFIIPLLKMDINSRRAVAIIWEPTCDSDIYNKEIPGLALMDFKVSKGRLQVTSFIRSNDIYFGWPANIFQMRTLQKYVAEKVNIKTGPLITFSSSAHIFGEHFEGIKKIIGK